MREEIRVGDKTIVFENLWNAFDDQDMAQA